MPDSGQRARAVSFPSSNWGGLHREPGTTLSHFVLRSRIEVGETLGVGGRPTRGMRTMKRIGTLSCVVVAALLGACDEGEDGRDDGAACAGGKCDNADEPPQCVDGKCDDADTDTGGDDEAEPQSCPDDDMMMEIARAHVRNNVADPDVLQFSTGRVVAFGDLDDDGDKERLVFPGDGTPGGNETMVLYLSRDSGCADQFAGEFYGDSIAVSDDRTNGARDLLVEVVAEECLFVGDVYAFDGEQYKLVESGELNDICDEDPE